MVRVVVGAALSAAVSVGLASGQDAQRDVPPLVQAQEALTGIDVVVTDGSGAVISNARVTVVDASGAKTEGITNGSGHLSLSRLRLGMCTVTVLAPGFMPKQTTISVPQQEIGNISLSPAPVAYCTLCGMEEPTVSTIASTTPDLLPEPTADALAAPSQTPAQRQEPARNPIRRFFSSLRQKLGG
jgi:hypothetical protein